MNTTDTITAQDVALAILDGRLDDDLKALADAIHARRKQVRAREAQMNALFLSKGDHVTMHGLSPKYLNDAVVEVVEVKKTRVSVKSIEGVTPMRAAQRVGSGGFCTVPLSCVTKVSD